MPQGQNCEIFIIITSNKQPRNPVNGAFNPSGMILRFFRIQIRQPLIHSGDNLLGIPPKPPLKGGNDPP